ncbi:MAG: hypothetical protein E6J22_18530 [Chloroflexi bacterium]|nr:MAG: hypothetical protein E6J22_18530 [Chloroflexota bacterium]
MMDCLHFMAPSDEELSSFVLDEEPMSPEAREHLEHCEICQQRLARYKQFHTSLVSRLYRCQCPSGTRISLYCAGLLAADEQMEIAAHLLLCPLCADEAADTRRFLAAVEPLPAPTISLRDTGRHLVATLVGPQMRLVRRGSAPATTWPRQYRAESIDLSLYLSRTSNGDYALLVIITSIHSAETANAFAGMAAELYSAPDPIASGDEGDKEDKQAETPLVCAEIDDVGNVVFSGVPAGKYILVVHLPERELVIEDLTIEPG